MPEGTRRVVGDRTVGRFGGVKQGDLPGVRHGVHAERCKIREEAEEPCRGRSQSVRYSEEAG